MIKLYEGLGGMVQVIEHLLCKCEYKPQYHQKKEVWMVFQKTKPNKVNK
jgi:hypothetical protein